MSSQSKSCVIIGASHAAAQLGISLRQNGWKGSITLVGEEASLPYNRPPLSKSFLAGQCRADDLLIRHNSAYEKADIRIRTKTRVMEINRRERYLQLDNQERMPYDKVALTVGARPHRLQLPGSDLQGIFYLRNVEDVEKIQPWVKPGKKAVIIGGGFIGLESAAVFRQCGMDVTILERNERILSRVSAPEISGFYTRVHGEEGVDIRTDVELTAFEGQGHVKQVLCADGARFAADIVVVAIGITPNTSLAEAAGLTVNDGIVVDIHCRTSDPDIVAAGDCTRFLSPWYHTEIRLESVQNAVDQARIGAAAICGVEKEYRDLPWFWSDQYDLKLQIAGLSQGHDEMLIRGDLSASRKFAAFFFRDGALVAVDAINCPQEFMFGKRAIMKKLSLDRDRLRDPSISMRELVSA